MDIRQRLLDAAPLSLVRLVAAPYIAGESMEAAVGRADELFARQGVLATLDMLGESIQSREDAAACRDAYLALVDRIADRPHCTVSLKPTSMGLHQGRALCRANIEQVTARAAAVGRGVTIDMEDRSTVDDTLAIYRELRPRYPNLGTVLQSRLKRTPGDIEALGEGAGRIRICLGAYPEPAEVALTDPRQVKEALYRQALRLLELGASVELATHDGVLLERLLAEATSRGVSRDRLEIQWLLGVPMERLRERCRRAGWTVRLYVPYCDRWEYAASYLKRRLLSNPKLLVYVAHNLWKRGT